jgi:hypothetical protein
MTDDQPSSDLTPAASPAFAGPWGSLESASTRHDGWTGAVMAKFCEALAETGIVLEACLAVGRSSNTAYSNRRRDPLFAAMWEAALGIARNRLADALLARSIEGSVEYYYRDGALVGEKRHIDNRLGLAVLKRLDRMAETGSPLAGAPHTAVRPERSRGTAGVPAPARDWDQALGALRTADPDAIAQALAAFKGDETRETHDPADSSFSEPADEPGDGPIRVWQGEDEQWWTDYPPPAGFDGDEDGSWGHCGYKRACTAEEAALLDASAALDLAEERADDEADRDSYFADLAADVSEEPGAGPEAEPDGPSSASPPSSPPSSSSRT